MSGGAPDPKTWAQPEEDLTAEGRRKKTGEVPPEEQGAFVREPAYDLPKAPDAGPPTDWRGTIERPVGRALDLAWKDPGAALAVLNPAELAAGLSLIHI